MLFLGGKSGISQVVMEWLRNLPVQNNAERLLQALSLAGLEAQGGDVVLRLTQDDAEALGRILAGRAIAEEVFDRR